MTAPRKAVVPARAKIDRPPAPPAPHASDRRDDYEKAAILDETARFTDAHQVYGDPIKCSQAVSRLRRWIKEH